LLFGRFLRTVLAGVVLGLVALVSPAQAQAPIDLVKALKIEVSFEKDTYKGGETAFVKVELTNVGQVALDDITTGSSGHAPNELEWANEDWGDLASNRGLDLAVGETKSVRNPGLVPKTAEDFGSVYVIVPFNLKGGNAEPRPSVVAKAKVVGKKGDITGRATDDATGNGVAGVYVAAYATEFGSACVNVVKTDASGAFVIPDLPAGRYSLSFVAPPGWKMASPHGVETWAGPKHEPVTAKLVQGESGIPYEQPGGCGGSQPTTSSTPTSTATTSPSAAPTAQGSPPRNELATTGVNVPVALVVGCATLGAGLLALLIGRRRRPSA
jgi:hypothetical protein